MTVNKYDDRQYRPTVSTVNVGRQCWPVNSPALALTVALTDTAVSSSGLVGLLEQTGFTLRLNDCNVRLPMNGRLQASAA